MENEDKHCKKTKQNFNYFDHLFIWNYCTNRKINNMFGKKGKKTVPYLNWANTFCSVHQFRFYPWKKSDVKSVSMILSTFHLEGSHSSASDNQMLSQLVLDGSSGIECFSNQSWLELQGSIEMEIWHFPFFLLPSNHRLMMQVAGFWSERT